MEAFPSYQSQYPNPPYPLEHSNDVLPGLKDANDTGFANVLSPKRLHHSLPYPPASGRSSRNHEAQISRARGRLQTRTSPPDVVRMVLCSPEQQQNTLLDSVSNLSAFPLPYRPPKAASHFSSPIIPLTSQEIRPSYHSPPRFQASPPGRYPSLDDSQIRTLPPSSYSQISGSKIDPPGYFSPQTGQQARDFKWPQSRSQNRRKYIPKGRRYDIPFRQRHRLGPRHPKNAQCDPFRKHQPFLSTDRKESGYEKRLPDPFYVEITQQNTEQSLSQPPRLVRCTLPSIPLDDQKDASIPDRVNPGCVSQYISPENAEVSTQPIRESKYWPEMEDDPLFFSNLSNKSELVSIEELVNRRDQTLKYHCPPPPSRQTIMKMREQGTQTDTETSKFPPPERPITAGQDRRISSPNKPQQHDRILAPPPPSPKQQKQYHHDRQQFSKDKPRHHHYRICSLTDTDTPRKTDTQQPNTSTRADRGLKRSRSDTEDYYYTVDVYHRRRADVAVDTTLSPGSSFSQRAGTPFYSRRRYQTN